MSCAGDSGVHGTNSGCSRLIIVPQRALKPVSNANRNTTERCRSNPRWNGIFRLNSAIFHWAHKPAAGNARLKLLAMSQRRDRGSDSIQEWDYRRPAVDAVGSRH
ncbi:MAG: hypothetical protein QOF74_6518 [Caballeronia mineralivorans]|jgi:hypothetical protein|nr:hypothetical protein [Caballeronia mineralivorans]